MIDRETKYKLRIEKRGLNIPIDKTAENYRCCPNCSNEFMAGNGNVKFCCIKCHDDFNNTKKKQERKATLHIAQSKPVEYVPVKKKSRFSRLKHNFAVFERIFENGITEGYFSVEYLNKEGVDLSIFEEKFLIESSSDHYKRYYLVIRNYSIYNSDDNLVLIVKNKK
jgi:hypothetical protein